MAQEAPGHTFQATALVHEAYLRLVGSGDEATNWDGRGHFCAAAEPAATPYSRFFGQPRFIAGKISGATSRRLVVYEVSRLSEVGANSVDLRKRS